MTNKAREATPLARLLFTLAKKMKNVLRAIAITAILLLNCAFGSAAGDPFSSDSLKPLTDDDFISGKETTEEIDQDSFQLDRSNVEWIIGTKWMNVEPRFKVMHFLREHAGGFQHDIGESVTVAVEEEIFKVSIQAERKDIEYIQRYLRQEYEQIL